MNGLGHMYIHAPMKPGTGVGHDGQLYFLNIKLGLKFGKH